MFFTVEKKLGFILMIGTSIFLLKSGKTSVQTDISEKEAIELAEKFIVTNGYTKYKGDTAAITFEFLYDDETTLKTILKRRHNTLYPNAFCITKSKNNWNVGFLSTSNRLNKLDSLKRQQDLDGKSVIVDFQGHELRMAHRSPMFSKWRKL